MRLMRLGTVRPSKEIGWRRLALIGLLMGVAWSGAGQGWSAEAQTDGAEKAEEPTPRAVLGVLIAPAEGDQGARVVGVVPDSPAAKAGLKEGDRLLSVDQKKVASPAGLVELIRSKKPGTPVKLVFRRGDEEKTVSATLAAAERRGEGWRGKLLERRSERPRPRLGMWVEPAAKRGVRVLQVDPGSPAAQAGVREGDVVLRIADRQVRTAEDALQATEKSKSGDKLPLVLLRDGHETTVHVTLAGPPRPLLRRPRAEPGEARPVPQADRPQPGEAASPHHQEHQQLEKRLDRLEQLSQEILGEVRELRKRMDTAKPADRRPKPKAEEKR